MDAACKGSLIVGAPAKLFQTPQLSIIPVNYAFKSKCHDMPLPSGVRAACLRIGLVSIVMGVSYHCWVGKGEKLERMKNEKRMRTIKRLMSQTMQNEYGIFFAFIFLIIIKLCGLLMK